MTKIFRYALYGVVAVAALVLVGCEVTLDPSQDMPNVPGIKPTVPLKKRPIVPTTKLPRPRVAEEEFAAMEADCYEATEWEYAEYSEEW